MASAPSAPASASATWWASPCRPWLASPRRPAWCARPCSWASRSSRRSRSSASWCSSSARAADRSPSMRPIRLLLAAAALALLGVISLSGVASATPRQNPGSVEATVKQAEANGATKTDAECITKLAEGKTVEDCQKAPNPLLPETNEIIWGAFGFAVVFFFLWKYGVPQARKAMDARAERIRHDLDAAEINKTEAETVLAEYQGQLADARNESARII